MNTQILTILLEEGNKLLAHVFSHRASVAPEPETIAESPEQALARIYSTKPDIPPSGPKETPPPAVAVYASTKENTPAQSIAVACVPCTLPTALVFTNPDVKQVQDILVGDKVLDAQGNYSAVTKIWRREYDGELILITLPYQKEKVVLTPEHPVLAVKGHACRQLNHGMVCFPKDNPRCKNCSQKRNYEPEFVPAGQLSTNGVKCSWMKHILLMPRLKIIKDVKELRVSEVAAIGFERVNEGWIKPRKENAHNRGRTAVAVRDKILVNDAFMALAGFYLSEGSANLQTRGGHTRFDFSREEVNYASEVRELLINVFGVHASTSLNTPSTIRVLVSSELLAHFFLNLFGKGALNKQIPQWMLTLPHAKQQILVEKYWRGDGSQWINDKETETQLSATTVSRKLAYNLRLILHRLGIIHNLSKYKTNDSLIDGRVIKSNGYHYAIQIHPPAAIRLAEMINFPIPKNWRFLQSHQAGIDENWIYLPIKKIERKAYKGTVMNLTTEPDNTYTVAGTAVHNCALGHYSTSAGLLNEAVRFKKDGMTSNEILDRIAKVLQEQNALERVDLTPERLQATPGWEKPIAEEALTQSRNLRHRLENVETVDDLQKIAAETETYYKKLNSAWFRGKLAQKKTLKNQIKEVVEVTEATTSEQKA